MPDYDAGFKIVAHWAGRPLSQVAGVASQQWEPIRGEVHAVERLADRAFRARQGTDHFVVYMEAYTRWQPEAPWSVLAKSGLLSERERLPTVSLLYILLPRGYRAQQGTFRLSVAGAPTQQVWFREICLWQVEPQSWWEEWPGLMALYPLCRHGRDRREAMRHAAETIIRRTPDRITRADLLTTLAIFGKLVYPGFDAIHLIGREQMKESKFFQEVQEEARAEERIEERRTAILDILDLRFRSPVSDELKQALTRLTDPEQLLELRRLATTCRRLTEFQRALKQGKE